jgi:hypothetical protein
MQDLAQEWYDTLSPDLLQRMDYNVDLWIIGFRARFARHPIVAQKEANQYKFSFAQDDCLDLRTYITLKQNLLIEVDIEDSNQIMNGIWRDLDPVLQMNVTPDPFVPFEAFCTDKSMLRADY